MVQPQKPLRLFVISHPRTVSNLFLKLYSEHPQAHCIPYPFIFLFFREWNKEAIMHTEEDKEIIEKFRDSLSQYADHQACLDKLEQDIAEGEQQGKLPMIKDHACFMIQEIVLKGLLERNHPVSPLPKLEDKMLDVPEERRAQLTQIPYHDLNAPTLNPTVLPDRLCKTLAPVFIIRHPAKQVGSWYRASRFIKVPIDSAEFELAVSYKTPRLTFQYYKSLYAAEESQKESVWPIVIDGDDLINDIEGVTQRFCDTTGLDHAGVIYEWSQGEAEEPVRGVFMDALNNSQGIIKNESPKIPSIQEEAIKWEERWGREVAHSLVQYAEKSMEDFEYLYQFRL